MTLCCQISWAVLGGSGRRLRSSFSFFSDSAFRTVSRCLYFSWEMTRALESCIDQQDTANLVLRSISLLVWHCVDGLPSSCLAAHSTCGPGVSWARCLPHRDAPAAVLDASPQRRWTWLKLAFWVSLDWPKSYKARITNQKLMKHKMFTF